MDCIVFCPGNRDKNGCVFLTSLVEAPWFACLRLNVIQEEKVRR
nr:MAG TPA: hypothetical protein [Caudoviricetes sp.]